MEARERGDFRRHVLFTSLTRGWLRVCGAGRGRRPANAGERGARQLDHWGDQSYRRSAHARRPAPPPAPFAMTDRSTSGTSSYDDPDVLSAAALAVLIAEHPAQLSLHELTRILGDGTDDWSQQDSVRVALRQLVSDGLAHQHGAFYFATHAAVRGEQLRT